MAIVGYGSDAIDDAEETELLQYEGPGVFVATLDASTLGGGDSLTGRIYSRVNSDSAVILAAEAVLSGAAPTDPSIIKLGPIVSPELCDLRAIRVGAAYTAPWRVEALGQVVSIEDAENNQLASGGEDTLVTISYGGRFVLLVDATLMQAADTLKLRLKSKGGDPSSSVGVVEFQQYDDAQLIPYLSLGPIVALDSCVASLEQSAGTPRQFPWKVARLI